ncbi:MAG: hypothetical protein HOM34_01805 [Planctomycetes bacterium]|jgi:S1-C subfamily serine protease|nr:hypothetical protein [Planctomycetota bacterium]MBT4028540.1 hypothetical protein [Planctomycetota bacterium]MBT4559432.1 hypothetical protein [Planctomycetota bacterium]MBT5101005.1 hypothetical protein [Planctomycetota bacterium]MBT5119437.1 hypothetical protein [Planctomycetota bacterium]
MTPLLICLSAWLCLAQPQEGLQPIDSTKPGWIQPEAELKLPGEFVMTVGFSALGAMEDELVQLYAGLHPSVVQVRYVIAPQPEAPDVEVKTVLVSGVVMGHAGFILAPGPMSHRFNSAEVVRFDGKVFPAERVGYDETYGFVLLRAAKLGLVGPQISPESEQRVGHVLVSLGNAFALGSSLGLGFISGFDRKDGNREGLLQVTNELNPGDGGGLLADRHGRLVGLFLSSSSVTFAVPAGRLLDAFPHQLGHLLPGRRQLGVLLQIRHREGQAQATLLVEEVEPGLAAAQAGVLPGDVLLGLAGIDFLPKFKADEPQSQSGEALLAHLQHTIQNSSSHTQIRVLRGGLVRVLPIHFNR